MVASQTAYKSFRAAGRSTGASSTTTRRIVALVYNQQRRIDDNASTTSSTRTSSTTTEDINLAHQHIGLSPTERQHKCLNTTADPYFKGPMFELETVHSQ